MLMKEFITWADFSAHYSLVLFNECVNLKSRENGFDEGVIYEWLEKHKENCEQEKARLHMEDCEEDCKKCKEYKSDYGDYPECNCEPYQWYAIAVGEFEAEWLNKTYGMDIFFSDILQLYILPVYHFGTGWDYVPLNKITG